MVCPDLGLGTLDAIGHTLEMEPARHSDPEGARLIHGALACYQCVYVPKGWRRCTISTEFSSGGFACRAVSQN